MTALPAALTNTTWTIDPSHSEASFVVRHAGIAKVRGTVAITEGQIAVTEAGASVTATLDPATVSTGDKGRDGHLTTADFFEVETYPTWTFVSTGVNGSGDEATVVGDLTIHGVTKQVELDVEYNGTAVDAYGATRSGFSAKTEFSRKDFGLTWNAALEAGGVLVSDKVKVELEISATKA